MIDLTSKFGQVVKRHLDREYFVWLTTIDARLTPQPRPVWYIWQQDSFLLFSQPGAHKVGHIRQYPNVALHFNTDAKADNNVIVFVGQAQIDETVGPAHLVTAYLEKYRTGIADLDMAPEEFSRDYSIAIRVTPRSVRGWE